MNRAALDKILDDLEPGDCADLRGADLCGADLRDADLRCADLWGVSGNRSEIKSIFISKVYAITYTHEIMQIGCENHTISDWWSFSDNEILGMNGRTALKFWHKYKDFIQTAIKISPANKP